jgi:hypothetical protein
LRDQPGAGFTFGNTGAEARSIDALVDDGLRVAEVVCERLASPNGLGAEQGSLA